MSAAATLATSDVLAGALSNAAENLRQSTVKILQGRASMGSGVIWREDGLIVTNAHVARGEQSLVEDSRGRRFPARLESRNTGRDLAALRIAASGLPAVSTVSSGQLRVGDLVLALGNPLGITGAVVTGIIHALGPAENLEHRAWIQADIRLAPGNSGGPLADARGRVAGINSMIARGLGLAVPADSVEKFLRGEEDQPRLGVTVEAVAVPASKGSLLGLLVEAVEPGGAAHSAGIRQGDVLIGYGARPFHKPADLMVALRGASGRLPLDVLRASRQISVEVELPR